MMSPSLGEGPAGPDFTILYCRPDGRATTPGALALVARNWTASVTEAAAGGAPVSARPWAWAAPPSSRAAPKRTAMDFTLDLGEMDGVSWRPAGQGRPTARGRASPG